MASARELHQLIHSLTKNERGFFIKYVQQQGKEKNYLRLFKVLAEMPSYDKGILEKHFKGEKLAKNLSVTQNYLFKTILKSLRLFNEKQDIESQLYNMLMEADILEAKGFKKASFKLLKKIKKIAEEHHNFLIILEALKRQSRQVIATRTKNILEETQHYYELISETIKTIEEEYTFRWLNYLMFIYQRREAQLAPIKYGEILDSIINHPSMLQGKAPKSFFAQILRHNIYVNYARINGDRENAHQSFKKMTILWDQYEAIKNANPNRYQIQLSNFLSNAIYAGKEKDFETNIDKILDLKPRNLEETVEAFQAVIHLKLLFYLNFNRLEEAKALLPELKEGLQKYASLLNQARATTIYYNVLVLHLLLGEFSEALDWVDLILRNQKAEARQDLKTFARILEFLIHYELGNDLILDSLFISATRRLHENKKTRAYEKIILKHFRKLLKAVGRSETKACLVTFKEELTPLKDKKPRPIGVEEMLIWLEARISGKEIRKVYEEML